MSNLTNQDVLNQVYQRFVVNKEPQALLEEPVDCVTCAYRGVNGSRCAIGGFIPDSEYTPDMESESLDYLMSHFKFVKTLFQDCSITLLEELQAAHDSLLDPEDAARILKFELQLREIASRYYLEYPGDKNAVLA